MRRFAALLVLLVTASLLATTLSSPAGAAPLAAPDVTVSIDDLPVKFDVSLQRENDRILVPFRAISEAIGVKVDWVEAEQGIIATRPASADGPAVEVRLWINRALALVNGQEQQLDVPPRIVGDRTLVPTRFFATVFGCGVDWDEASKRVLVTTGERTMTIYGFYAIGKGATSSWTDLFGMPYPDVSPETANYRHVSSVGYGWYSIDSDYRLRSDITDWRKPGGWDNALVAADRAGLTDDMVIFAGDQRRLASLLGNQEALDALRRTIVSESDVYNGVNLDWENLGSGADAAGQEAVRTRYADFVSALATDLHAIGKTLTVTVQPGNGAYAAGFDYAKLGVAADRVVLMAYDYYDRKLPSPMAPLAKVEESVKLLIQQGVEPGKILLGMAPGGVEWVTQPTQSLANALPNSDVASYKSAHTLTWDPVAMANWTTFQDAAGRTFKVWIEDGQSISLKIALAKRYGLRGVAVWRLGDIPGDVWTAIDAATKPERAAAADTAQVTPNMP